MLFLLLLANPIPAMPRHGAHAVSPHAPIILHLKANELSAPQTSLALPAQPLVSAGGRILPGQWQRSATTLTFLHEQAFPPHTRIEVTGPGLALNFTTGGARRPRQVSPEKPAPRVGSKRGNPDYPSSFPYFTLMTGSQVPTGEFLFLAPYAFNLQDKPYLLLLDAMGEPLFWRKLDAPATDFKSQLNGSLLTWYSLGDLAFHALDQQYEDAGTFRASAGLTTDEHELRLLPNGHALLIYEETEIVDLTPYHPCASSSAELIHNGVQELDEQGIPIFDWNTASQFAVADQPHINWCLPVQDYAHLNAIEVVDENSLLISARHLDAVFKLDRQTGDVLWIMGGTQNQFAMPAHAFCHQHAIRQISPSELSLFDNGNNKSSNPGDLYSRALVLQIDENNLTAVEQSSYRHVPDVYSWSQGYHQVLSGGHHLVGWGAQSFSANPPACTIASSSGPLWIKSFELTFDDPSLVSYRAQAGSWQGAATRPYLSYELCGNEAVLYFDRFGTQVDSYRIYYGRGDFSSASLLSEVATKHFDLSPLPAGQAWRYWLTAVQAGVESPASDPALLAAPMAQADWLPGWTSTGPTGDLDLDGLVSVLDGVLNLDLSACAP
jgi:hypothetical protein